MKLRAKQATIQPLSGYSHPFTVSYYESPPGKRAMTNDLGTGDARQTTVLSHTILLRYAHYLVSHHSRTNPYAA